MIVCVLYHLGCFATLSCTAGIHWPAGREYPLHLSDSGIQKHHIIYTASDMHTRWIYPSPYPSIISISNMLFGPSMCLWPSRPTGLPFGIGQSMLPVNMLLDVQSEGGLPWYWLTQCWHMSWLFRTCSWERYCISCDGQWAAPYNIT